MRWFVRRRNNVSGADRVWRDRLDVRYHGALSAAVVEAHKLGVPGASVDGAVLRLWDRTERVALSVNTSSNNAEEQVETSTWRSYQSGLAQQLAIFAGIVLLVGCVIARERKPVLICAAFLLWIVVLRVAATCQQRSNPVVRASGLRACIESIVEIDHWSRSLDKDRGIPTASLASDNKRTQTICPAPFGLRPDWPPNSR
jgi:hypothetical protein